MVIHGGGPHSLAGGRRALKTKHYCAKTVTGCISQPRGQGRGGGQGTGKCRVKPDRARCVPERRPGGERWREVVTMDGCITRKPAFGVRPGAPDGGDMRGVEGQGLRMNASYGFS